MISVARKTAVIPKTTRFEDALSELETLVRALESGEQSLDESLAQFERGIALSRFCRQSLANAERQVKILLDKDGEERLAEFDDPDAGKRDDATDKRVDGDGDGSGRAERRS